MNTKFDVPYSKLAGIGGINRYSYIRNTFSNIGNEFLILENEF